MDPDPATPPPSPAEPPPGPFPGVGIEIVGAADEASNMIYGVPVLAHIPATQPVRRPAPPPREPKKRWRLGIILFLITCASMWVSASEDAFQFTTASWNGTRFTVPLFFPHELLRPEGPLFMFAMMSVLFSHEMGHFLQSLRYKVPASVPYFIPMPLSPIGTMGAVIIMGGRNRNRRELFDIGLSGPWAGLLVALPIACYGILHAGASDPKKIIDWSTQPGYFPDCLLIQWLIHYLRPELLPHQQLDLTPLMRASWGATLLTGLNMLPVGQLDGGHVSYALFGRRAHWIARITMLIAGAYIVFSRDYGWSLMYLLALLMRPDHPATHDDSQPLGWPRWTLGFISLFIPIICLAPLPNF